MRSAVSQSIWVRVSIVPPWERLGRAAGSAVVALALGTKRLTSTGPRAAPRPRPRNRGPRRFEAEALSFVGSV